MPNNKKAGADIEILLARGGARVWRAGFSLILHPSSLGAGGSPGAGYLFLRGQAKVTEKKAAQFAVPYGDKPALLDNPGGLRNSRTVFATIH